MRIAESLKEKFSAEMNKGLLEKWNKQIEAVTKVYPKLDAVSKINIAICCENTQAQINKYNRMSGLNEATQSAEVGPYVRHVYDIITAILPNLVADEVVSVQAMSQKIGQIFFLKYVYGSNKGTIKKGDTAFGPYEVNANENYTSETVDQEIIADGSETAVTATLQWGPVLAGSVVITAGSVTGTDNGEGQITGSGITGTVDYTSGALSLTFTSQPNADVNVAYKYSLEYAPTQATELNLVIDEKIVQARPRRLKTQYAFSAAYDVEKQFGIDMDDELLDASVAEIRHEIDQEILNDLYRQAGQSTEWDATPATGVTPIQHVEAFAIHLNAAENMIRKATKRVKGNFIVAGINTLNIIESMPGYIPGNAEDKIGAYVAGTVKGHTKVIANPFYGDDQYLVGFKGDNFLHAGYVYAPYMPVVALPVMMLDDFLGRRGYATSYAKAMLCPNYYVKGILKHSAPALNVNVVSKS